ncbi:MAG TPA: Glu/Leu/Phe/Val dehydrogenase dimerization domain-containing protein [Solirubrobacteraceae bacterium]|nr:Glu/Leu/Phe/Val dehydrogenase dimerization domain-containing protein [Solirubrobacteraceae bacterium]
MPRADSHLANLEHEELLVRRGPRSGLYCIVAVHSTVRGPGLGGCRMWSYADSRAAIADALRLSRAMTYKAAVAELPLGGGKGVIMLRNGPPQGRARTAVLLDFADTVDAVSGRYITAEDVGTSARDMTVIARGTSHVSGLARARGGSGDPSPWTAVGVEAAVLASVERVHGGTSLKGRSAAVVGLGSVGLRLAQLLAKRGAKLIVADIDKRKRAEAAKLGARWMTPEKALLAPVDILAPCALGGVLDDESVAALQAPVVAGAANNQLADESVAEQLQRRGVLWAPDFVANAGGIINIAVEFQPGGYDPRVARKRVQGVGDTLRAVYDASASGATPLAAAMSLARRNLSDARA